MTWLVSRVLALVTLVASPASGDHVGPDPCGYFFRALATAPHEVLTRGRVPEPTIRGSRLRDGCEVRFVTNDRLRSGGAVPALDAAEGTALYRHGWRPIGTLVADGSGTASFGIARDDILCLISYRQPAYVNERTGEIVRSTTLHITVQCGTGWRD